MCFPGGEYRFQRLKNFKLQNSNAKQITMTEIQNSTRLSSSQAKQFAFDLICDLDTVIWNLFGPILRSGGACYLSFPVYQGLGSYVLFFFAFSSK
jgi:hypothetical protein